MGSMTNDHYPNLFRSADAASASARRMYVLLQGLYLGSLLLGSGLATLGILIGADAAWLPSSVAIVLVAGLLLLWIARAHHDEKSWFDCRALAESTKTATWRYMMCAPPYRAGTSADERFVTELREIRQARPGSEEYLAGKLDAEAQAVTDFMRDVRSQDLNSRMEFYLDQRLRPQRTWYSLMANANARSGSAWFWTTLALQVIAVAMAIARASSGGLPANVVPFLATAAAAVASWSQMKRFDELKQSYALAAEELAELEAIATGLKDEGQFQQLVRQVEGAISREHTMWCARRDMRLASPGGEHPTQREGE